MEVEAGAGTISERVAQRYAQTLSRMHAQGERLDCITLQA